DRGFGVEYRQKEAMATISAAMARGARIPNPLMRSAPASAPPNIARIESIRRPVRAPSPPAIDDSGARPVTVNVSTVVVRSRTASFRAIALRNPIAKAVQTITAYALVEGNSAGAKAVTPVARTNNTHSAFLATRRRPAEVRGRRLMTLPPSRPPNAKTNRAVTERIADKPCAPPRAKARKTTLPVMFAVKI